MNPVPVPTSSTSAVRADLGAVGERVDHTLVVEARAHLIPVERYPLEERLHRQAVHASEPARPARGRTGQAAARNPGVRAAQCTARGRVTSGSGRPDSWPATDAGTGSTTRRPQNAVRARPDTAASHTHAEAQDQSVSPTGAFENSARSPVSARRAPHQVLPGHHGCFSRQVLRRRHAASEVCRGRRRRNTGAGAARRWRRVRAAGRGRRRRRRAGSGWRCRARPGR